MNNNPVRYSDPSGHWAILVGLVIAAVVILKVIDYGWTAYDAGSALITAANANNSPEIRKEALASAAVAVGMELIEPDDISPVSLPLDDLVRHGDDIIDAGKKAPAIIGENMKRVSEFAKKNGGVTINDFIPSSEWSLAKNTDWIKQMVDEGREIIDIGPHFNRRLDDLEAGKDPYRLAYNIERMITKGYENYRKVFERLGKWRGGVPGIE